MQALAAGTIDVGAMGQGGAQQVSVLEAVAELLLQRRELGGLVGGRRSPRPPRQRAQP